MKTRKKDSDAPYRARLAPLADALAQAPPGRRRELAAGVLETALPASLRILIEVLISRLDDERSHAGAADALVALGPATLPALQFALLDHPPEARLVRLAAVLAVLGHLLPLRGRTALQMTLMLAAGRAPTLLSRAALEQAVGDLRDLDAGAVSALGTA